MSQLHCLQENRTLKYLANRFSDLPASNAIFHWGRQAATFSILHSSFSSWTVSQQWNAEVTKTAAMGWGSKRWLSHSKNRFSTSASHHSYAWAIPSLLAPVWQVSGPQLAQFISQNHRKPQSFFFLVGKLSERKMVPVAQYTKKLFKRCTKYLFELSRCSYVETGNVMTCFKLEQKVCGRLKIRAQEIAEIASLQK